MVSFNGLYDIHWTQEVDERAWLKGYKEDFHYDMDDLKTRFELCVDRYVTWKSIISRPDIQYDDTTNTVQGSVETWESICHNHELGPVYAFHRKEPMWTDLIEIFDTDKAAATAKAYLTPSPIAPHIYTIDDLLQDYYIEHARLEEHDRGSGKKKGIIGESIPFQRDGGRADTASTSKMRFTNPDFFTGTPEKRFDRGDKSKAKRSLDF